MVTRLHLLSSIEEWSMVKYVRAVDLEGKIMHGRTNGKKTYSHGAWQIMYLFPLPKQHVVHTVYCHEAFQWQSKTYCIFYELPRMRYTFVRVLRKTLFFLFFPGHTFFSVNPNPLLLLAFFYTLYVDLPSHSVQHATKVIWRKIGVWRMEYAGMTKLNNCISEYVTGRD